jgi:hypothetical protein
MPAESATPTFRSLVCDAFQCAPEDYAEVVFERCLFPHAALPVRVLRSLFPEWFGPDFQLIQLLARCTDALQLQTEVKVHRRLHPAQGFVRRTLRLRLSGQRLIDLGTALLPAAKPAAIMPPRPAADSLVAGFTPSAEATA